jgi:hypothetical protein
MKISEMTMRGPDLSKQAEQFANNNKDHWLKHGKHIANIEKYQVIKDNNYYSLWDDDTLVAYCSLIDTNNLVDNVYVAPSHRGQKIFSMMLWFFKTRMNRSPLMIGQVHSKIMQDVVKGMSRFNKSWINIKTNEKQPFSIDTLDQYYSYLSPTDWRLILENSGEFNWPMKGGGFVIESYEPYVD